MNIQGVSQSLPAQGASRPGDSRVKALEQQISELEKRIREVRKNEKLDDKSKQQKIKEYEDQIQLLQLEKTKLQAEERQSKQKKSDNDRPAADKDAQRENQVVDEHVQNAFIKADSMKKAENELGVARERAKGELRIAESKSLLRSQNPADAAKARGKIEKIDRYVSGIGADAIEELEAASYETALPQDTQEREEDSDNPQSGTGRMEPGQFLDDHV